MDVRVRVFGGFELTCDGVTAIDGAWRPAKAAAIVKMLALRPGRSILRDQLITALWPESDVEAGTNSLYKNLHELRKTVRRAGGPRDVVHLVHPNITLAPYVAVDLDEFRQRASEIGDAATSDDLMHLLAIGGEPLLPDDLYEPWTEPHRTDHQLQAIRIRLRLATLQLEAAAFDQSIEQYRAVLSADNAAEEAHLGLMRAYVGLDRRDLALRQYEQCKEVLAAELDAGPSDEVEALASDLRRALKESGTSEAIDECVRDGDAAVRRHAYDEAVTSYREAIRRLRAAHEDDEREAGLWLKLAAATSGIGTRSETAECCRRAAALAERAGAFELLASALVQFQDATDAGPGDHAGHRESAELIESALARLPADELASRAMLLAAGARPLAASTRTENEQHVTGRLSVAGVRDPRIESRLREAVAIARGIDRPEIVAMTLTRLRTYITSPDTLDERLDLTREMLAITKDGRHPVSEYVSQLFRHEDLLEVGDIDGARIQARNMRRLGESINSSGILAVAFSLQATHATADGPLTDAALMLRQSRELDEKQGTTSNSQNRFGSQLLALRWHQGRIGEMEAGVRRALDVFPRMTSTRAALAFITADIGQLDNASIELGKLTEEPIDSLPKDFSWWSTTVFMSYAAIATDATDVARSLYRVMAPYEDRNASSAGAISFGSAALFLALLAGFLDDRAAAEEHFEKAMAFNVRTRQRVWTARTRFHFADMLITHGGAQHVERARELARVARADAQEIGMNGLVAKLSTPPFASGI